MNEDRYLPGWAKGLLLVAGFFRPAKSGCHMHLSRIRGEKYFKSTVELLTTNV